MASSTVTQERAKTLKDRWKAATALKQQCEACGSLQALDDIPTGLSYDTGAKTKRRVRSGPAEPTEEVEFAVTAEIRRLCKPCRDCIHSHPVETRRARLAALACGVPYDQTLVRVVEPLWAGIEGREVITLPLAVEAKAPASTKPWAHVASTVAKAVRAIELLDDPDSPKRYGKGCHWCGITRSKKFANDHGHIACADCLKQLTEFRLGAFPNGCSRLDAIVAAVCDIPDTAAIDCAHRIGMRAFGDTDAKPSSTHRFAWVDLAGVIAHYAPKPSGDSGPPMVGGK